VGNERPSDRLLVFYNGQDKKMAVGTDDAVRVSTQSIASFVTTNKKHLSNEAAGFAIRGFPRIAPFQPSLLT